MLDLEEFGFEAYVKANSFYLGSHNSASKPAVSNLRGLHMTKSLTFAHQIDSYVKRFAGAQHKTNEGPQCTRVPPCNSDGDISIEITPHFPYQINVNEKISEGSAEVNQYWRMLALFYNQKPM